MKLPLLLLAVLLVAAPARAELITVNFAGQWGAEDFEYLRETREQDPEHWALDDGLRAAGAAASAPGTYLWGYLNLSLTFDTSVEPVVGSWGELGYHDAVTGKVWLGDYQLTLPPTTIFMGGGDMYFWGPSFTGPLLGGLLRPGGFQFSLLNTGASLAALSNPLTWQTPFAPGGFIGFNNWTYLLQIGVQPVSYSIPEPATLLLVGLGGLLANRRFRPGSQSQ